MKNLEKVFRCGIVFCLIFNYASLSGQTNRISVIDTLHIKKKLIALVDIEKSKNVELINEQYDIVEFYISKLLDSISNDYMFYKGNMTFDFRKALYFMAVYCVWDIHNKKFIDINNYDIFNQIVASMNTKLNCYDKALLYELLTFRQLPGRFAYRVRFWRKYEILHAKKFTVNKSIWYKYFSTDEGFIDLSCNKKIYPLLNSSTTQVLYLPRITLSEDGRRKVKDFFIQVFYFNEDGALVNTILLDKFMTLKPCD